jgi:hypothetical protein
MRVIFQPESARVGFHKTRYFNMIHPTSGTIRLTQTPIPNYPVNVTQSSFV